MGEEYKGGWKLNNQGPQIDQLLGMVAAANAVANGGVAPGGFGLGEGWDCAHYTVPAGTNLNTLTKNGWYYLHNNTSTYTNGPTGVMSGSYSTLKVDAGRMVVQTMFVSVDATDNIYEVRRTCNLISAATPVWSEWEWVNPPLNAGQEYRTTERFLGKPVYAGFFNVPELSISTFYGVPIAQVAIVDSDGSKITGVQAAASLTLYGNNNMVLYQTPTADSVELYSNRGTLTLLFRNLHDSTTFPTTGWKILAKYIKS